MGGIKVFANVIVQLCVVLVCSMIAAIPESAAGEPYIFILTAGNSDPYRQAVDGFSTRMSERFPGIVLEERWTDGSREQLDLATRQLNSENPDFIFALGEAALNALDTDIPVVASLVMKSEVISSSPNAMGIVLEATILEQLTMLQKLLPSARRIGVIYDPQINQALINEAIVVAETQGLMLSATKVSAVKELPTALRSLARRVDVIWGIPDSTVMNNRTARSILLESFRHKIPVIGPTPPWTKAGALYSLEWDYVDIGQESADLAIAFFQNRNEKSTSVSGPRKIGYSLNLNTAERFNIQIPDLLVKEATVIFE